MKENGMIDKMRATARGVIAAAKECGCDEAQVSVGSGRSIKVGYEKNDFNLAASLEETACSLVIHKDRRKGSAQTNDVSTESLRKAVENALAISRFSVPDEYLCLPDPAKPAPLEGRFDPAIENLPMEQLRDLAQTFLGEAKSDRRISMDSGEVRSAVRHNVMMNSRGLDVSDAATSVEWSLMGMGIDGKDVTSFDYLGGSSFRWKGSEEEATATARALRDKLLSCFGARKGESYRGHVLLSPAALSSLLISPLCAQLSGKSIVDNSSRWGKALGERVAAESLTMTDDPFDLRLAGAGPYDGEGVPTRKLTLLEKGVLKAHFDSTYTARRRGTQPTGHAGFAPNGLSILPGTKSLAEMRKAAPTLVEVNRFSGNVDPISGNFSGIAKGSRLYKNGELSHPLKETMIAGNFFELLRNIAALSDKADCFCNGFYAPFILVDGVSVSVG
ncbi:MAG: hypothetical protein A2Z34_10885 [Planctomycetes bacterium RBG_16_59_8]|nr:MAG: hypothetical protein A2Z34_10885 [Planctomycetes bacterium RBG_16_59_8]